MRDVHIVIDVLIPVVVPIPVVITDHHCVLNCEIQNEGKNKNVAFRIILFFHETEMSS